MCDLFLLLQVPYVEDSLALVYHTNDLDPNSVCVMQWAEWLRDEFIAKQIKCEGHESAKPKAAAAVVRVNPDEWMDFSMAKGK